jgi:predicted DNA-binding protein
MKQTAINFTSEQYEQLKDESKKTGISIAGLVRLAVMDYFSKKEAD